MSLLGILENLLNSNSKETMDMVQNFLQKHKYKNIVRTNDYLLAEGDTQCPVAAVCHADTVWGERYRKQCQLYHDSEKQTLWAIPARGMDDKAGIAMLMIIIANSKHRPSVIITNGEEQGCIGSKKLVKDYLTCPFDVHYLLQLDRRGANDCVFYHEPTEEFQKYIESFGWERAEGTYSDTLVLEEAWRIASVNVSVGYYNEHTPYEILKFDEFAQATKRVQFMLAEAASAPRFASNAKQEIIDNCEICDKPITSMFDINLVSYEKDVDLLMCDNCARTLGVKRCGKCNNLFWNPEVSDKFCINCEEAAHSERNKTTN